MEYLQIILLKIRDLHCFSRVQLNNKLYYTILYSVQFQLNFIINTFK